MSRTLPDTRPLTRSERDLIVAARRHLRADGWTFYHREAEHRRAQIAADWTYAWNTDGKDGRVLRIRHLTPHGSTQQIAAEVDVDSVREAIDVVVALGLLPQGMSSQYKAGIEAPRWTGQLTMRADQIEAVYVDQDAPGWQILDARDEVTWHDIASVAECDDDICAINDILGITCVVVLSRAFNAYAAHLESDETAQVRIPAGEL